MGGTFKLGKNFPAECAHARVLGKQPHNMSKIVGCE